MEIRIKTAKGKPSEVSILTKTKPTQEDVDAVQSCLLWVLEKLDQDVRGRTVIECIIPNPKKIPTEAL
jgi:hypothetical protein